MIALIIGTRVSNYSSVNSLVIITTLWNKLVRNHPDLTLLVRGPPKEKKISLVPTCIGRQYLLIIE